jgi:hypothetical protein
MVVYMWAKEDGRKVYGAKSKGKKPHKTHGSKRFSRVEIMKGMQRTPTPPALVRVTGDLSSHLAYPNPISHILTRNPKP